MQPGETITPGVQPEPVPPQAPAPEPLEPQQPVAPPEPEMQPAPEQPVPGPEAPPEPQPDPALPADSGAGWQFHTDDEEPGSQPAPVSHPPAVTWSASEYVAHDKNAGWYLLVVLASAGIAAIVYLVTREWISAGVVGVIGMSFAAFGARKPQILNYAIDHAGVHIGQKLYPYSLFRTFSVIQEEAMRSILLSPMKRFNLPISVYYDPADEEEIVEALGSYLPHEDRQPAAVDNFMRKIRF